MSNGQYTAINVVYVTHLCQIYEQKTDSVTLLYENHDSKHGLGQCSKHWQYWLMVSIVSVGWHKICPFNL